MSVCRIPSLLPRCRTCRGRQVQVRLGRVEMLLSDHPFVNFLILSASTFFIPGDCSAAFYTPIPAEAAVVDDRSGSSLVRLECGKGIISVILAVRLCRLCFVLCRCHVLAFEFWLLMEVHLHRYGIMLAPLPSVIIELT
jgi:hypothetical protein